MTVQSTAEGLTQESLEHIFDRFYRGDASHNSDRGAGHGIGLSIAQMIVTAHKVKISASIQERCNLLITVTIPL